MMCQKANQQFNWTGDFRLETPTEEMRNDERIFISIFNGFERNGVKVDIVSDIVTEIFELADIDLDETEEAEKEGAKDE